MKTIILLVLLAACEADPIDGDAGHAHATCQAILKTPGYVITDDVADPGRVAWWGIEMTSGGSWDAMTAPNDILGFYRDVDPGVFYLLDPDGCPVGERVRVYWNYDSQYSGMFAGDPPPDTATEEAGSP